MEILEEMILECDNIEELDLLKEYVKKRLKEESKPLKKCNHPIVYYLDYDIEYQETQYKYLCLKCKNIVDGTINLKIMPKSYLNRIDRSMVAKAFSSIYDKNKSMDDIVEILNNFQQFLDREHLLDNLVSDDSNYINNFVSQSFNTFISIKSLVKKEVK